MRRYLGGVVVLVGALVFVLVARSVMRDAEMDDSCWTGGGRG